MVASMRVLFSSTRGAGHLQPLLPYARALVARRHEVAVAAPEEVSKTVREAGLPHLLFDHPGDDSLAPIWARRRGASEAEMMTIAASELFAGVNARTALPKLQATIREWRPDLVVRDSVEYGALVAAEAGACGTRASRSTRCRSKRCFLRSWAPAEDPRPLVYITFGSIVGSTPHLRSVYRTSLDAVADLPVRALLTTGRGLEPGALGAIPANVHVEQWIPQRDILPRAAALVCHGGSGTLLGGSPRVFQW